MKLCVNLSVERASRLSRASWGNGTGRRRCPTGLARWRQFALLALLFASSQAAHAQQSGSKNQGDAVPATGNQTSSAQRLFPREALRISAAGDREALTAPSSPARSVQEAPQDLRNRVLNPNDLISVKVYQEPDLDAVCRVGKDGTISFWLLGDIKVGGRTVQAANNHVRDLLKKDFLVNPQVNITILEFAKREFTIWGNGAQRPGSYAMPDDKPLTLPQAIAMAGGYKPGAKLRDVLVTRFVEGKKATMRVDARNLAKEKDGKAFVVLPDDHIEIDESFL